MRQLSESVTRLLDDLGQSQLAGDLTEELHAGRSRVWMWWQVSAAIMRSVRAVAGANPYLTFRAVTVGWIVLQLLNGQFPFHPELGAKVWIHNSPVSVFLIAAQYFVAGWVVARLHQQHRTALVLATGVFLLVTNCLEVLYRTALIARMQPPIAPSGVGFAIWILYDAIQLLLPLAVVAGGLWGGGLSGDRRIAES